jgi:hypothetical protein
MDNDRIFQLDSTLLSQFEHVFGVELKAVRIHTGSTAHTLCKNNNAEALTIGSDIYFANSKYTPYSEEGLKLLTHELQHVVQYQRGDRIEFDEEVMEAEHQAEKASDAITSNLLFNLGDVDGIESAIPQASPTSPFSNLSSKEDNSSSTKETTLTKGATSENKNDEFMDRSDFQIQSARPLYQIMFRDGSSIDLNKGEMESMRREFQNKVKEWLRESEYNSTEEESNRKSRKFLELMAR